MRINKTVQMNVITFTTSDEGACKQESCRVPSVDLGSMISKREREGGCHPNISFTKTISQTGKGI